MSRFETFSFLPPLSPGQIESQVENMLEHDLLPLIEFAENPAPDEVYWKLWPLPRQAKLTTHWVMSQIDTCAKRFPFAHIRLCAFDRANQQYATSFVVKAPQTAA